MRYPELFGIAALAGAVALGCDNQPSPTTPSDAPMFAAAAPAKEVTTIQADFTEALPCAGEDVHWTGTITIRTHTVVNRGAVLPEGTAQHFQVHVRLRLTGVGTSTGDRYRWIQEVRDGVQSESLTAPTGSHTMVLRTNIIGPARGLIGVVTLHLIEVATPSGHQLVPKADLDATMECR